MEKSETRELMKIRDNKRELAARSQLNSDWGDYRIIRNRCSVVCKLDKKEHYKKMFENHEDGKDVTNLYKKVKFQLG